ncbi:MAG: response regulator [Planctomycetes bacterium]|nr:response regulator [Planctomycetota bacterium]
MMEKPLPPLSILIVEDQEEVAQSLAELLRLIGHETRVARSGEDALTQIDSQLPDVILLDIGLPGMNGWEVARQIRDRAKRRQPVVVAVTGFGLEADKWRSADAGADLHLVKPVAPAVLVQLLERVREHLAMPSAPAQPSPKAG